MPKTKPIKKSKIMPLVNAYEYFRQARFALAKAECALNGHGFSDTSAEIRDVQADLIKYEKLLIKHIESMGVECDRVK